MRRTGLWANLATLANGAVGVGAVLYVLAGNQLWAMLLIVSGIGFDGLDGWLHRRSGLPGTQFGRVADSLSDAVTFGIAPATLLAYHPYHAALWAPYSEGSLLAAAVVGVLALTRLAWFTVRGYAHPDFLGAPTPQNALGVVVLVLVFDVPAFLGTQPAAVLLGAVGLSLLMVVPIPFPKMRKGTWLRWPMAATGVALVTTLLPLQFGPDRGTALYDLALLSAAVATVGIAAYYIVGPWTVPRALAAPTPGVP
ncbi:MAG: CDP-alcohol phosphatidyltransferase family protein [Thermoplasmata archaeon]|nr:CDP-alcohol phosphatidyltransferase family protein [Thermoplasmata archaeon]MCI4359959.1 CDP-alcohol phosphatidyltransferase family protein [Thermoplasmata archaeon]